MCGSVPGMVSGLSWSTSWDMLQQAKVRGGGCTGTPALGRQRKGWLSTGINQPFLLAGGGGA